MTLKRNRIVANTAIIAISVGLVIVLMLSGVLQRAERITYDQRMRIFRADAPLHPDLAVILIDEVSLQTMGPVVGRWPWPRQLYASLIEFFALGGAKAVCFNILFSEHQMGDNGDEVLSDDDLRFIEWTAISDNVFHAMQVIRETHENSGVNKPLPPDFIERFTLTNATDITDVGGNNYLLPIPGLYQNAHGVGIVGIESDFDGVYRRIKLFRTYEEGVFPSMGIAPLLSDVAIKEEAGRIHIGGVTLPLDEQGNYLFNMVGRIDPYSISGIFASIEALQQGKAENLLVYPDEFTDKIVFIGSSAIGLQDARATPLSTKTPGVFMHASVASNFLQKDFLQPVASYWTVLLVIFFAVATTLSLQLIKRIWLQVSVPFLIGTVYTGWSIYAFSNNHVYPIIAPLSALLIAWLASVLYLIFTEGKDKLRVRTMLSQYVSPAMLAEVVDHYEDQLTAGVGKRENLSILFSDVRSFTSISESRSAEEVVNLLNTYLEVMVDIIFRYHGTLDKFIGDAVMAFWGAPIRVTDHADRAVKAALTMANEMPQVNKLLAESGYPSIAIGLGIDTGDVVLGNIGSTKKLDYTIIGDSVNRASRLESLTKMYGCPIIISEFTRQALTASIPCATVDMVRVKGRQEPLRIYWPLCLPDSEKLDEATRIARITEEAFDNYLQKKWQKSIDLYRTLPDDSPLCRVFEQRCSEFDRNPPDKEWNGVYTMTTK